MGRRQKQAAEVGDALVTSARDAALAAARAGGAVGPFAALSGLMGGVGAPAALGAGVDFAALAALGLYAPAALAQSRAALLGGAGVGPAPAPGSSAADVAALARARAPAPARRGVRSRPRPRAAPPRRGPSPRCARLAGTSPCSTRRRRRRRACRRSARSRRRGLRPRLCPSQGCPASPAWARWPPPET